MSWPHAGSPFHAGERAIQARLGVRETIETGGRRLIRDFLPDEHREFYAGLPFLILGTVDPDSQPWASIAVGKPGFVSSPDSKTLRLAARSLTGTRAGETLGAGGEVGVLGIDLATRRRNRANGVASAMHDGHIDIAVTQAYGNCPKYIQRRRLVEDARLPSEDPVPASESDALDAVERATIATADTFFIASAFGRARDDRSHGVDASHRGGDPGFVRVDDAHTLTVPDFVGNFAFNTLGNLLLEPRCGLLFLDFATGTTLEIAADAEIIWDGPEVDAVTGAERLVRFHVSRVRRSPHAITLRWRRTSLAVRTR